MDTGRHRVRYVLVCTAIVWFFSMLSISMSTPTIYSPFSLPVVIPALIASMLPLPHFFIAILGALPNTLLFSVCMFKGSAKNHHISNRGVILITLISFFAVIFNAFGFLRGIEFQGLLHTLVIAGVNFTCVLTLPILFWRYRQQRSLLRYLACYTVFFVWFGFSAFPWFGELL